MKTFQIEDIRYDITGSGSTVAYLVYPAVENIPVDFLNHLASGYGIAVVTVYIAADDWNNYLTPWPEPPESPGFPPFEGKGAEFLKTLTEKIVPQAEEELGITGQARRTIIGVSLSGLFALWQWLTCDCFENLGSLSGSFWYVGFPAWLESLQIPAKRGKAFFLLGRDEPNAKIKAYRSVGVNTEQVVEKLKASGISTAFRWVAGNHFSDPLGRLEIAFDELFNTDNAMQ